MSTSPTPPAPPGQPLPTAPDFPVVWADPREAKITWDLMPPIAPAPLLTFAFVKAFLLGSEPAFEGAGLPINLCMTRVNTFQYFAIVPKGAPPEAVMKGMGMLSRAAPGVFKL